MSEVKFVQISSERLEEIQSKLNNEQKLRMENLDELIKTKDELIKTKDELIAALEEIVELLKQKQQNINLDKNDLNHIS